MTIRRVEEFQWQRLSAMAASTNSRDFFVVLLAIWAVTFGGSFACNEAVCASMVSKCLLTQSCKCNVSNYTCSRECFACLSYLYDECCSCVELCPKPNTTDNPLSKKSHVEDFDLPAPGLFEALTLEPDDHARWFALSYPIDLDTSSLSSWKRGKGTTHLFANSSIGEEPTNEPNSIVTLKCTVAFLADCSSWHKCKRSCQSMGASSYRWFHDGCCECVGGGCINYGVNESRCESCPSEQADEEYDDYGQKAGAGYEYED